jgi:hypothetical protein
MKLSTAILCAGVTSLLAACAAPSDSVSNDQSDLQTEATTTVAASGQITDRATFNPIVGAKICVVGMDTMPCGTSGSDGSYTLQVPGGTDVALSITEATHVTNYLTVTTADAAVNLGPLRIMDKQFDANFNQQAGGQRNDTTGTLVVAVFNQFPNPTGAVSGVALTTSGGGGHEFYTDTSGNPDSSLQATTDRGVAGFVNMRPGPVTMWIAADSMNCKGSVGWNSTSGAGAIKTKIFAGGTTVVYGTCVP